MAEFDFSFFTRPAGVSAEGSALVPALHHALRDMADADRWEVATSGLWCGVTPKEHVLRPQGWKLHLSATPVSAEAVLTRSLTVLLKSRSGFKFVSTVEHVAQLNARHTPRGQSGKFITVYPFDDDEAVRLADALHEATAGLAGPRILSDRPYLSGSLVHYRYGAFVEERRLSNDGLYSWVIFDPDGNPVEDRRAPAYQPPAWAVCPFPAPAENAGSGASRDDRGVLVGDRFLLREAIRHSNKGGVYRGVDTQSGAEVVIKEARPHVETDKTGRDVRDLLRAEAKALEMVSPLGVAPRPLKLFEQSQHLFLAEELVPGTPLCQWVPDRIRESGWRRRVPEALEIAARLVELMDLVHQADVILRDFNPNNVMVRPDGRLELIDLEFAALSEAPEEDQRSAGTPGYSAPEQMKGAPPAVQADYYSLGATICFVVTGNSPAFLADEPERRPLRERLAEWLAVRQEASDHDDVRMLILGLMDDEPERRWTTAQARNALAVARERTERQPLPQPSLALALGHERDSDNGQLGDEQWHDAVDGAVGYLLASMNPANGDRLWPGSCANGAADPCSVQLGAAGVIGVLTRCFELTGDERLPEAIATAGGWLTQRLHADATRPPGLHFGDAGVAWSLYEAGRALDDNRLTEQGLAVADAIAASSRDLDITHGTAGIGLTFLHLWLRTRNEEFLTRVNKAADRLIASARTEPGGLIWGTPAALDSRLSGGRYYGYAHGTAGVGWFLLAAALATGRSDCLTLARQAGETLLTNGAVGDGAAMWGAGPGDATTAPYWCHGSSGIGSYLIRLHRATGDDRFEKLADMSARAVMEHSWRGVLGQCHGLAGNGEFLLDMADMVDGQRYESLAHQLARVIYASRAYREGRAVFPDQEGGVNPSWADGVSGVLAFLLRLKYRSPRLWMVDSLLERDHRS
jgi:rhamnogalacturonyl hydrolase YesR/tRNA A-37 threonylcarbamoyl transferase component Bud32